MSEIYLTIDDQDYKITSNKNEWKLYEYHGENGDGDDKLSNTRHYSRIEHLVEGIARKSVRTSDYESMKDLSDNINRITDEIKSKISVLLNIES